MFFKVTLDLLNADLAGRMGFKGICCERFGAGLNIKNSLPAPRLNETPGERIAEA